MIHQRGVITTVRASVVAGVLVVGLAGCSGEDVAESLIERQLRAEGADGADVDISEGQVRIRTEEGVVEMVAGEDGSVRIRSEGTDGTETVIESDGDGVMTASDGESSFVASSNAQLPDDFPAGFPLPDATLTNATRAASGDEVTFILVFEGRGSIAVSEYRSIASELEAQGYTMGFESSDGTNVSAQFSDGTTDVFYSGGHDPSDDISRIGLTLSPSQG